MIPPLRLLYNEIDDFAAQWLRNLVVSGLLPPGTIDQRSIRDLQPEDVNETAHFFAGIGGWPLALQLAGWPDAAAVWTGSCPCQPFSLAGKRAGTGDERHLWPEFFRLIRARRPPVVFGEQVASSAGYAWFDLVSADLEREGYTTGAADLAAASVGAPHVRQRLYWMAYAPGERFDRVKLQLQKRRQDEDLAKTGGGGTSGRLAAAKKLATADGWRNPDWLPCRDGKARPIKPGIEPLAPRFPGRVGRLRAYGNAIVPALAAEFVGAFVDCILAEP